MLFNNDATVYQVQVKEVPSIIPHWIGWTMTSPVNLKISILLALLPFCCFTSIPFSLSPSHPTPDQISLSLPPFSIRTHPSACNSNWAARVQCADIKVPTSPILFCHNTETYHHEVYLWKPNMDPIQWPVTIYVKSRSNKVISNPYLSQEGEHAQLGHNTWCHIQIHPPVAHTHWHCGSTFALLPSPSPLSISSCLETFAECLQRRFPLSKSMLRAFCCRLLEPFYINASGGGKVIEIGLLKTNDNHLELSCLMSLRIIEVQRTLWYLV